VFDITIAYLVTLAIFHVVSKFIKSFFLFNSPINQAIIWHREFFLLLARYVPNVVTVLGSQTAVLWQDRSQTGLGLGLGLILLVLLPTLLCTTRRCVTWQCWNVTSTCVLSCNKYRNSAKCYWSSLSWRFLHQVIFW